MKYLDILDGLYPEWHARAACNHGLDPKAWPDGHHPDNWFPTSAAGRPPKAEQTARDVATEPAKKVCEGCPVRDLCEAASAGETWGVWAETDREKWRKSDVA